jgi:hypothetical protein
MYSTLIYACHQLFRNEISFEINLECVSSYSRSITSANFSIRNSINIYKKQMLPTFSSSSECFSSGINASLNGWTFSNSGRFYGRIATAVTSISSSRWPFLRNTESLSWSTSNISTKSSNTVSILRILNMPFTYNNTVNELSGIIDLETTLVKAEALFKKFQRTVELIDRKGTFPAPLSSSISAPKQVITNPRATPALLRAERSGSVGSPLPQLPESPTSTARREGSAVPANKGKKPILPVQHGRLGVDTKTAGSRESSLPAQVLPSPVTDVVSPELRNLLRRDAPWMDRKALPGSKGKKTT